MTWSTLPAYSDGNALTAAQMTAIKDNINETAPAKASGTFSSAHFVSSSAANTITERQIATSTVATSETTTNTSYANLATVGPSVTITTGVAALTWTTADMQQSSGANVRASTDISGATTSAATDSRALLGSFVGQIRASACDLTTLTAGSNTILMKYRQTGGAGTSTIADRKLAVMAL